MLTALGLLLSVQSLDPKLWLRLGKLGKPSLAGNPYTISGMYLMFVSAAEHEQSSSSWDSLTSRKPIYMWVYNHFAPRNSSLEGPTKMKFVPFCSS